MPRKKTTGAVTGTTSSIKFAAILAFFRTSPMEIVKFAQELINDAVKEREAKGKAVLAGRAASKGADSQAAVDKATASAVAGSGGGPTGVVERKKPGPAKGTKRGGARAAQGSGPGEANNTATSSAPASAGEVTDAAALPPQEGVLDLDAQK